VRKSELRKAQLRWIAYRDAFTSLARAIYGEASGGFDPAHSMVTMLTKARLSELTREAGQ
jgi:uncharacterized protein YecT (DUF1311 family)